MTHTSAHHQRPVRVVLALLGEHSGYLYIHSLVLTYYICLFRTLIS